MSSGLMSCVRENSPPLDLDLSASGPLSLPEGNSRSHSLMGPTTSTPIASPLGADGGASNDGNNSSTNAEQQQQQQQKRRRFHPLRNLRRIFRRRTINSADSHVGQGSPGVSPGSCNTLPPPASSSSEKNLRSVTVSGVDIASASSPSSPLTQQQLHESYQTQSLPKSKSYGSHRDELLSVLLGKKRASKQQQQQQQQQQQHNNTTEHPIQGTQPQPQIHSDTMYQAQQRQHMGVAVFPDAMSMSRSSYFAEKRHHPRELRSVGDSTQDLDAEDSGAVGGATDMSDSQRSLSEARLLDADDGSGYTRESLSQSHDSVFSESATASSLSIVLKAELTDVLRKRRNRPDASDEDLGLPRSPASPQRHLEAAGHSSRRTTAGYQPHSLAQGHEVSSLSLVSANSTDGEDSHSHRQHAYRSNSSSVHSGSDILRHHHQEDEVDSVGLERQRLSHAAAKHKMAIRPPKKKGPTRQHRLTLESSIPEVNEELAKLSQIQSPSMRHIKDSDIKTKTRSLPPGSSLSATSNATASVSNSNMRIKTIEQKNSTINTINSDQRTSTSTTSITKSSTSTSSSSHQVFGVRGLTIKASNGLFDGRGESSTDGDDLTTVPSDTSEPGFLRRLMQRNSKRSIARVNDGLEDLDNSQNVAKKLQISTSCVEASTREPVSLPNKSRSALTHEQHIQETRHSIKREIQSEGKHGINAMVSNYGVQPQPPTAIKPKSGPAARQRYMPQELGASSTLDKSSMNTDNDVTNLLSKSSRGSDAFQSTALVREQSKLRTETTSVNHFERKPRIVGLSAFQQKLSRSSDSVGQHSSSSNSLETSTDEPSPLYYEEKQRKTVEKARSFRNYDDERDANNETVNVRNNMPSLPDLSISFRVPTFYKQPQQVVQSPRTPLSPMSPHSPTSPNTKCVSLGFEVNDKPQVRTESIGQLPSPSKISPQHSTKLIVNSPAAVTQSEKKIESTVKSPVVSVLRKPNPVNEPHSLEQQLPPQRPKVLELRQTTIAPIISPNKDASISSPLAKNAKVSNSPPSTPSKSIRSTPVESSSPIIASNQPEFMKIQLNRVDQARLHAKTNHLVLAKNVKASSTPAERSQSSDDLSMKRLSIESTGNVQIVERSQKVEGATTPSQQPHSISQPPESSVLARQQRAVSANSLRSSYLSTSSSSGGSCEVIAPVLPASMPNTPRSGNSKPLEQLSSCKEKVNANRFSLDERKRLFLSVDKSQVDRKIVGERKKSITEEQQRKPEASPPGTPITPTTPVVVGEQLSPVGNAVVLRKKSFAMANGNSNASSNASMSSTPPSHEDGTPELMKVFARRSLKVKDDDAVGLAQVVIATSNKKISNGSQSVDSDKENQSNSEEKLDKLTPKYETQTISEPATRITQANVQNNANNRSTVADFRNLNNNNSNNNNNQTGLQKLANLPPIKGGNVRHATVHNNNNNNSNNISNTNSSSNNRTNNNVKPTNERYSLQLKQATPTAAAKTVADATPTATASTITITPESATPTKAVERSATVGEFKGIHQRRAEWEQRVKEALK